MAWATSSREAGICTDTEFLQVPFTTRLDPFRHFMVSYRRQASDLPALYGYFLSFGAGNNVGGSYHPEYFFRVARDYHYKGIELLTKVTFPAVLPQVITSLRVSYGIAWVVIVAAEMVGCQDGLGYGIWEARNGLRLDSAICYMIVIGLLGMLIDRLIAQLTKLPNVKWGYER